MDHGKIRHTVLFNPKCPDKMQKTGCIAKKCHLKSQSNPCNAFHAVQDAGHTGRQIFSDRARATRNNAQNGKMGENVKPMDEDGVDGRGFPGGMGGCVV